MEKIDSLVRGTGDRGQSNQRHLLRGGDIGSEMSQKETSPCEKGEG